MAQEKNPESVAQRFNDIKQEIAAKAFSDGDFRSQLMADPQRTIASEYGLQDDALKNVNINILEEQPGVLTIPIPPAMEDMELTDEQLEQVAGGITPAISIMVSFTGTLAIFTYQKISGNPLDSW